MSQHFRACGMLGSLCVWFGSVTVSAQSVSAHSGTASPQAPRWLTCDQAVAVLRGSNPETLIARARTRVAQSEASVVNRWPNPQVWMGSSLNFSRLYGYIRFQLPIFGQINAAEDAADAQAHVVLFEEANVALQQADLVRRAWVALWLQQRIVDVFNANRLRAEQLAQVTASRFDAGTVARLDVLRSNAEASRVRALAIAEQVRVGAVAAQLQALLGQDAGAARLVAFGEPTMATARWIALFASADAGLALPSETLAELVDHPRMMRAQGQRVAAASVVQREERTRWPLLGVELGGNALYANGSAPDVHAAVLLNVPLFDLDGPTVVRAQAMAQVAEAQYVAEHARLVAELQAAFFEAAATYHVAQAFHEEVVVDSEAAATLAVEGYAAGRLDINAVLLAQQAHADASLSAARATAEAANAWSGLQRALGRFDGTDA